MSLFVKMSQPLLLPHSNKGIPFSGDEFLTRNRYLPHASGAISGSERSLKYLAGGKK